MHDLLLIYSVFKCTVNHELFCLCLCTGYPDLESVSYWPIAEKPVHWPPGWIACKPAAQLYLGSDIHSALQ